MNIWVQKFIVFSKKIIFCSPILQGKQKRYATSSNVKITSFVNVYDVKSAEKRYACLKVVNNKTKINMTCVSSYR